MNLAFPFAFHAALGDQQQILDRLADGDMLTDLKHPRHRQSSPDPIFSKPAQCRHVVCQDNALLVGRPCEQVRIIDA